MTHLYGAKMNSRLCDTPYRAEYGQGFYQTSQAKSKSVIYCNGVIYSSWYNLWTKEEDRQSLYDS